MLVSLLLLGLAAGTALFHHGRRSGWRHASALVALLLLGSGCFVEVADPGGSAAPWIAFSLVVVGLAIVFESEPAPGRRAAELYPGGRTASLAYLGALLVALAVLWSPIALGLVPAAVAGAAGGRRKGLLWLTALACVLYVVWSSWRGGGWPSSEALLHRFDPGLYGWNLTYLFAGRSFGLLIWFLPALLLAVCYRPGIDRRWLLGGVVVGTLALPLVWPHHFWGGAEAGTNAAFLPLYGALWFVPALVPKTRWLILTAIAAGLFLWPAWLSPLDTATGVDRPSLHERSLAHYLPYETTQEHAPAATEWQGTGVLSRSLGPGLEDSAEGPVLVAANGPAELMIASERPLEAVLLDFGPRAGSDLLVTGGEVGNTVLKPDGGVRFEVEVGDAARRHPMWFSDKPHSIYLLEIEMPGAPAQPLPVAILARPRDALPRSLDPSSVGEVQR